jgi:CBS-domain-containing membrane protein
MQAQEAMTKDVVTVSPEAAVGEIAGLLVRHRISAVPVVAEDNRVVGIVSQTDLGHRSETATEKKRKWWLEAFANPDAKAREFIKSHAHKAKDIMSRFVVSVSPRASLAEVADILDSHRIRQVPVMEGGKLLGMISRADLVRKLAEVTVSKPASRSDNGALQKAIWEQIKAQSWLRSAYVSVQVRDGVAELWGAVDTADQHRALRVLVEGVPGVVRVEDRVGVLPQMVAT